MEKSRVIDISNGYLKEAKEKARAGSATKGISACLRPWLFSFALLLMVTPCGVISGQDFRDFDPSGQWKSMHGVLSLMLAGVDPPAL